MVYFALTNTATICKCLKSEESVRQDISHYCMIKERSQGIVGCPSDLIASSQ